MNNNKKKLLLKSALKEHHAGNLDSADKIYRDILKLDSKDFDANHLHGAVLSQNKKFAEAVNFFAIAYESSNVTCELLNNYGIALRNLRAFTECEKMLSQAIELDNKFPNTYLNLSNCYVSQEKYNDAVAILKKSIDLDMNVLRCQIEIVSILFSSLNESFSEDTLNNLKDNLVSLSKSNDGAAISKCALIYHNIGEIEKSLELFKKSEKIFSESLPNLETLKKIESKGVIESFVKHEFEQIRHIDSDQDGIRNMKITQEFYNKLENLVIIPSSKYSDNDYLFISELHKVRYNKPPKIQKNYINTDIDVNSIENSYCESTPEIAIVDDFLSLSFLNELRIFFRCANIYKYPYSRGYIGAFLGKGMANRALLEFSNELTKRFKKIFHDYYLSQAWSFKYDSTKPGIGIHADDAKVNVNFWITDEKSNKNKDSGGMIIWKKTPDLRASFHDFNSIKSISKMNEEVKNADFVKVPYQSNRAVIFNSKLYHATDNIDFLDNYNDRRVNITFLYK